MIKQFLPARLPKIILPLNVSPPWNLKFSSCTPCLADDTIIPPLIPGGRGGHYEYCCCLTISGFFVFCWVWSFFHTLFLFSVRLILSFNWYFCTFNVALEACSFKIALSFSNTTGETKTGCDVSIFSSVLWFVQLMTSFKFSIIVRRSLAFLPDVVANKDRFHLRPRTFW